MSVTILKDVEEALLREFRNILINEQRTNTYEAFPAVFDPFTGEQVVGQALEGRFYDSSDNARNIEYPHVYIKVLRSEEDLTSGRLVPPYGNEVTIPVPFASRAFNIIAGGYDLMMVSGNSVTTSNIKAILFNNSHLLSIISGPNAGTYKIASITLLDNGPHTIVLSPILVSNMPVSSYTLATGVLTFLSPVDLTTVAAGDIFNDSTSKTFTITAVNLVENSITIDRSNGSPSTLSGSSITRTGNILKTPDSHNESYFVLDPSSPIVGKGLLDPTQANTSVNRAIDWSIPLNIVFGVTIDTKNFNDHTSVWNRVWEEFNPPRRGLPIIVRTPDSSESFAVNNCFPPGNLPPTT